jgi:MFS family permease
VTSAIGWRGPFRHRNYRLFWSGQLVSLAGTWMQTIAQAWLITELTPDPVWLGVVAAAQFTPVLIFGLFGGVLADVLPKRQSLIGTQGALMLLALLQALLVALGIISIPILVVLAMALGTVNAVDMPIRQSFFSEMVPQDEVGRAVAFNSAMFNGARVVGPAIGGVLISVIGVAGCFAVNGASFLATLLALAVMREVELHPAPRVDRPRDAGAVRDSLLEGLRYVRHTPIVALCVFVIGVISGVAMNFNVVIPPLSRVDLGIGAAGLGGLMAAVGLGSLLGALIVAALREPRRKLIVVGGALLGAFSIAAGVAAASDIPTAVPLTGLALFGAGFGAISMAATANASIQTTTPAPLRGRVMSVYTTVFAGSTPIGGLATGVAVSILGASGALALAGALAVLSAGFATVYWRSLIR